ncbi:MAG: transposase [Thermoanaerobaculia bacterium]
MARRLRFIPEGGALVEVTCRTMQGRFLLKPSDELKSIIIGVLARAQRLYPVELHAFVFLSNHYHLLLSVDNAPGLARFMNFLNSNRAREAGRLHGWREKFWGRRYQAIVISQEEAAQIDRLRYLLSHGCKEGLVARPREWPGAHCVEALLEGLPLRGLWFDRTQEYAARARREEFDRFAYASPETVRLEPLPCWQHLPDERLRSRVAELVLQIETETADRHANKATRPLGVSAVLAQHPHDKPLRSNKALAPAFHAASKAARRELVEAYRWFVGAYREAAEKLRQGDFRVGFPAGSFPPRLPVVVRIPDLAPG